MANQVELEELKALYQDMIRGYGTNLAGQPMVPDGSYGYYTPDFSYGSYKIPYQDPTYSSGYEYARTIAGGMPFEDVVAPGMSFSPDQPMGYTQADLMPKFVGEGPVPVMPSAPTKGTPLEASYETMPDAPVGTPAPERYVPGQTPFPGIPDFLKDLDFSNLPGVQEPSKPQFGSSAPAGFIPPPPGSFNTMAFVDYYNPTTGETWSAPSGGWTAPEGWVIGRPDGGLKFAFDEVDPSVSGRPDFDPYLAALEAAAQTQRDVAINPNPYNQLDTGNDYSGLFLLDENLANLEEIADKIDMDEVAKIDIEKIDIPESVSLFSDILNEPVSAEPAITEPVLPSIFDQPTAPVMPTMPMEPMVQPITAPVIPAQTLPQNIFANIPTPQPLPMPVIPRIVEPRTIPTFVQPSVEEIVSPIRTGRTLPSTPRGLFSL